MTGDELTRMRLDIGGAVGASVLLDRLLSPTRAEAIIRSLPVEDLYRAIMRIGLEDCIELLPMISPEQFRALLDFDAWPDDRPDISRIDPWMRTLMQSGVEILTEKFMGLDDALINWVVREHVHVDVIEDPDSFVPPEGDTITTQDNRMCLSFRGRGDGELPIKVLLDWLMRVQPEYCYNLLVFSAAALDSHLEEEAYRWRSGRMADLGFVDPIEALGLYTAPRRGEIAAIREQAPQASPGDAPWLSPIVSADSRLHQALAALDERTRAAVTEELAYVCNTALSADRVALWDTPATLRVMERVRAGLALGLDALGDGPEDDRRVLTEHPVALIFRTGYARTLDAAEAARRARRRGLLAGKEGPDKSPIDAVDAPALRLIVAAMTSRHPQMADGRTPSTADDLQVLRACGGLIEDLVDFPGDVRPDATGLCAWRLTRIARDLIGLEGQGALPITTIPIVHGALFADGRVTDAARSAAHSAWLRLGGKRAATIDYLLDLAALELAAVAPAEVDPRAVSMLVFDLAF